MMKPISESLRYLAIVLILNESRPTSRLASASLLSVPVDEEVVAGDSVVFPCSTDLQHSLHWLHTPVGSDYPNDVYFHGRHVSPYWPRFRVQKDEVRGEYNLTISAVQSTDAGTYTCIDKAGHGVQWEAQLVVLGSTPVGHSNTTLDQLSVCGDNEPATFLLTCDANYTGNIPPELNWKEITKHGLVISHTHASLVKHSHGVSYSVMLKANHDMDGSVFVCETSSAKYNWTSGSVILHYASNSTLKEEYMSPSLVHCRATSNAICEYAWTQLDRNGKIASTNATLDLVSLGHGQYQCTAVCELRGFKCEVYPHLVEFTPDDQFNEDGSHTSAIVIAVSIVMVAAVTAMLVVIIVKILRLRSKKNRPTSGQTKFQENPSNTALLSKKYSISSFEAFIDQFWKPTLVKSSSAIIKLNLQDTISVGDFQPRGIVNYNNLYYVVLQSHHKVRTFEDVAPYCAVEDFIIDKMEEPWSLEISQRPLCLYIPDRARKSIWKVRGLDSGMEADEWMQGVSAPFKLSVTRDGNVLIPEWPTRIKVFDSSGHQIKAIDLRKDLLEPYHAVETSTGSIVVCHGDAESKLHRVCLIKSDGTVLWSFGSDKGNKEDQLHNPHHLVLDEDDRIYLSDQANMRIVVLDGNGQRLAFVDTEKQIPYRSFYASKTRSLLVCGYGSIFCYALEDNVV